MKAPAVVVEEHVFLESLKSRDLRLCLSLYIPQVKNVAKKFPSMISKLLSKGGNTIKTRKITLWKKDPLASTINSSNDFKKSLSFKTRFLINLA